ncbi:MAG: hypothetical protein GY719_40770 [bacterium]|nr:hypothetical protein [bacterium]
MTRRQLLLALLLLAIPTKRWDAQHEAPWLRGVAAVYCMLSETQTVSTDNREDPVARSRKMQFAGVDLRSDVPARRLARESFATLARKNPMAGMTREDRDQLDRNLWTYIGSVANERQLKHLDRQWGAEGKGRSRPVEKDVAHVESCRTCRSAYNTVTRERTTLRCQSDKIGKVPKDPRDPNSISIPP